MVFDPVTSKSRSVALRLETDSVALAGRGLNLEVAPKSTATARTLLGEDPASSVSVSLGLGVGDSRFFADSASASEFFDSQNITLKSGGNSYVGGEAVSTALSSSPLAGDAKADSINIAIANVDFLDRYGGVFRIGSTENPFSATSNSISQLETIGGLVQSDPASISAKSVVRGLEGSSAEFELDGVSPQELFFLDDRPSFYGQLDVNVEANSLLNTTSENLSFDGDISSNAVAIEGYQISNIPIGNLDQSSSVRGSSLARISTDLNSLINEDEALQLSINADGIRNSLIHSAPLLDTTIEGQGFAVAEAIPVGAELQTARASGISSSIVATNAGDDVIQANAGLAIRSASSNDYQSNNFQYDVAAIDESWISSGSGNDKLHASILSESEAVFDLNGNGIFESDVYLDSESINNPLLSGFAGFRNSFIHTGSGNDSITGTSLQSELMTDLGDDSIILDRLAESSIWSGLGDDVISADGPSLNSIFWGGQGNDQISVHSGTGNTLNGGLGQDHITSGEGTDTISYSDSASAVRSASATTLSEDLGDAEYWDNLSSEQKSTLWTTGVLKSEQDTDTVIIEMAQGLTFGEGGDVLTLSSAMAGFTQDLWNQYGQIYEVDETGSLSANGLSASGSQRIGFAVGKHEDLMKMGTSAPSFAYATDTKTLLYDSDGFWDDGARMISIVQSNQQDFLKAENLRFE